ncbi:MAG: hypothetical protein ACTSU0_11835 [Alphaproteobacteria bacterium]
MQTTPKLTEISSSRSSDSWRLIDLDGLPETWPKYRPLILQALMAGEGSYNERDVMVALLAGQWMLFAVGDPVTSICVTEVVDFPRQRKYLTRYAVGDGEAFYGSFDLLEKIARQRGCDVIEMYARPGWIRKLPDWSQKYVILQKEL